MRRLAILLACVASPAAAQLSNPPLAALPILPPDLATNESVQSAIAAATPATCPTPMRDTLMGSAGAADRCMPRSDATRPTVIQAKTTTTNASADYEVTFDTPFDTPPIYGDARVYGTSQPYLCTVFTLTRTGAAGRCFQLVATTLPTLTTALGGLVISPFASAASGLSVRVVARQ